MSAGTIPGRPAHFGCGLAQGGACSVLLDGRATRSFEAPSKPQVRKALAGNLCRCGSHARVIRTVLRAEAGGCRDGRLTP